MIRTIQLLHRAVCISTLGTRYVQSSARGNGKYIFYPNLNICPQHSRCVMRFTPKRLANDTVAKNIIHEFKKGLVKQLINMKNQATQKNIHVQDVLSGSNRFQVRSKIGRIIQSPLVLPELVLLFPAPLNISSGMSFQSP